VPGDEALRPLGHPRLHLVRTSGSSDLSGAELGRCNGHSNKTYPLCGGAEGSQTQSLAHSATVILALWSA
jgi:hypothetical protein